MDTKKLRQKILDLAIRGKLVPQDPNDEPASVLLERIRAEKEQLIKAGKIKRSKQSASDKPHYENVPFEIPKSWEWVKLGDISNYGSSIHSNVDNIDDDAWILELEDIEKDSGKVIHKVIKKGREISGVRSYFRRNQVLYAKLRTYLSKVLVAPLDGYCTTEIIPFSLYGEISPYYIAHVLRSAFFIDYTTQCCYGCKMPRLGTSDALNGFIPLPPIAEQKRLVTEIEQWFAIIDEIETSKQDLEKAITQTKSKILSLAISGKIVPQYQDEELAIDLLKRIDPKFQPCDTSHYPNLPQGWCLATLGDVGKWQSGGTPNRKIKEYYGGNIPWLKTGDLNDGFITNIPEKITQAGLENSSAKLNPAGSVLVAMYGATIGKIGILTFPATTNQACCACVEYPALDMMYLYYFLLSNRDKFIAQGGGGAQPNISKEIIINTHISIPPLKEQKRIVDKISEIFKEIDSITAEL